MITGTVDTHKQHLDIIRLAWEAKGVKEVIDEVRIVNKKSNASSKEKTSDYAQDGWITTKVKALLLNDQNIASRNYHIKTLEGVVYMMGVAQSKEELNHAKDVVKDIKGVKKVVSYVRIKDSED